MSDDRQRRIDLIDSLRARGSFESARDRLTTVAGAIAEGISTAVPGGQPWKFDTTSDFAKTAHHGSVCAELPGNVALKPAANPVEFDPPLTAEGFRIAVDVIRRVAAEHGATEESALFGDSAKREYSVSGNGYRFRILQMDLALLTISADCRLLQKVLDPPPGQMP